VLFRHRQTKSWLKSAAVIFRHGTWFTT